MLTHEYVGVGTDTFNPKQKTGDLTKTGKGDHESIKTGGDLKPEESK